MSDEFVYAICPEAPPSERKGAVPQNDGRSFAGPSGFCKFCGETRAGHEAIPKAEYERMVRNLMRAEHAIVEAVRNKRRVAWHEVPALVPHIGSCDAVMILANLADRWKVRRIAPGVYAA